MKNDEEMFKNLFIFGGEWGVGIDRKRRNDGDDDESKKKKKKL